MGEGGLNTLPQRLRQFLLDQPETTDDLHVVSVILKDGRVFEDVAISLGFWTGDQALLAFRTLS